tara:strand:+ start:648 stop:1400 length:753 start_codon:yes stop_codon:yes gene_type:complete
MFHLGAYYESVDQGGVAADIAGVPDEAITVQGDALRVPKDLPNLGLGAIVTAATTLTSAELQAPSLRQLANFSIEPLNAAATPANPPALADILNNPRPLVGGEDLTMNVNSDNTGAVAIYGLAAFTDGAVQQATGEMFSIRFTTAITLAAGTWVNGNVTFSQDLPFGQYAVVGLRVRSTNLVAARLAFVGGGFRPGVLGVNAIGDVDANYARYGRAGVWGTFESTSPPTLDGLGVTDTTQSGVLDLIKVG